MFFPHFNEMESLCNAFAEGKCDNEDLRRLEELVLSSDAAARYYVRFFNIHTEITNEYFEDDYQDRFNELINHLHEHIEKSQSSTEKTQGANEYVPKRAENASIFPLLDLESILMESPLDGEATSSSERTRGSGGISWGNWGAYVPIVISLVSLVLVLGSVFILPVYWAQDAEHDAWKVVARIKRTVECRWKNGEKAFSNGEFLISGQKLELEFGLAEIEFASGAKVILQGPAQFTTIDKNASRLLCGRLTASVPKGANGFTVLTPEHEVVDLGTEFGVLVGNSLDETTEIHVFKGLVEVETNTALPSKKTVKLAENEAIICDTKTKQVLRVPANPKTFARDLDSLTGVTKNLRLSNPSFELPDIRTIPEFQPEQGDTDMIEIRSWKYSGIHPDGLPVTLNAMSRTQPYVTYQISPYESTKPEWNVGPGATDGRQVVLVELREGNVAREGIRQAWIYQSLGTVGVIDVGRHLLLEVDAGARTNFGKETGTLLVGFATHVTAERAGVQVGAPGILNGTTNKQGLKTIQATLPITPDLIGQELFVVLTAMDSQDSQYHFDNVRVSTVLDDQKGEKNHQAVEPVK